MAAPAGLWRVGWRGCEVEERGVSKSARTRCKVAGFCFLFSQAPPKRCSSGQSLLVRCLGFRSPTSPTCYIGWAKRCRCCSSPTAPGNWIWAPRSDTPLETAWMTARTPAQTKGNKKNLPAVKQGEISAPSLKTKRHLHRFRGLIDVKCCILVLIRNQWETNNELVSKVPKYTLSSAHASN